jgi:hypothetical protein
MSYQKIPGLRRAIRINYSSYPDDYLAVMRAQRESYGAFLEFGWRDGLYS